ncbi:MAG: hypothetical protein HKN13_02485 [Rhodothermales bacterium]|nr:hypothetical protein [Rhodothermales bacterium]
MRRLSRVCRRYLSPLVAAFLATVSFSAFADGTATINVESEAFDLDGGAIHADDIVGSPDDTTVADIRFAYHADRTPHAVAFPAGDGIEMALIEGAAFDTVTSSDIAGLVFSSEPTDTPFVGNRTMVIRTDTGAVYKIGNATEGELVVTFDYAAL